MVSIRKRGKVYECRIEIASIDGVRKWLTKSGFKTRQEALHEGAITYNEYYQCGKKQKQKDMSYADYLDYWIDNYRNFNLKYSTIVTYLNIIKLYLKPRLGMYKLSQLDSQMLQEFINDLSLQEKSGSKNCVLCGNENIKKGIDEWKKIFEDKTVALKTQVITDLNTILAKCYTIISDKKIYEPVAPVTIANIIIFVEIIEKTLKELNSENAFIIEYKEISKEKFTKDILKKYEAIANYILKKYKDKTIFLNSSLNNVGMKIKSIKEAIEKNLKQNVDIHKQSINEILKDLGLDKEISVDIDRLGGKIKYSLSVINSNLSKLSDGQKHKLALAIFLNTIKNDDLKEKTIVFDDPVVSLDELGYHFFKQYIIKNIMNNPNIDECPNLIILTHNFNYLYIPTSNIIINSELQTNTKILKLNSDGFKELDFELFKLDDIALFKKCLDNIKYEDELLDLSSLYNKIFREFLDLKLRILGNPLNGNPKEEIKKIIIDEEKRRILQRQSDKLCSYSKDENITIEEAKDGFNLLSEMLITIGFDEYISQKNVDLVNNVIKREKKIIVIYFMLFTKLLLF